MQNFLRQMRLTLAEHYPANEIEALAKMILRRVCHMDSVRMILDKDKIFPDETTQRLRGIIERLRAHEPLQYILGEEEFYGLTFHVEPGVLIPRPETEELVELILSERPDARRILDIGTGSGCIAISLAKHLPKAELEAWDISPIALRVARENAERLEAGVRVREQDVFASSALSGEALDVIVSNPPYVTESEKREMEPHVLEHEPHLALFVPDEDPLRYYRRIAEIGRSRLIPGGSLYFEINSLLGTETRELVESSGYQEIRLIKDLYGRDRIVVARQP